MKTHFEDISNFQDPHATQEKAMLRLQPNDMLSFQYTEPTECVLDLTCLAKCPITYKIQTTSPEKFRVRPRCGILMPGDAVSINILLKPDHKLSEGNRDKFLIMSVLLPPEHDGTPQELTELWKTKTPGSADVEQHRLCCQYKGAEQRFAGAAAAAALVNGPMPAGLESAKPTTEMVFSKHLVTLERQQRSMHFLQYIMLFMLLLLIVAVGYLLNLQINGDGHMYTNSKVGGVATSCIKK